MQTIDNFVSEFLLLSKWKKIPFFQHIKLRRNIFCEESHFSCEYFFVMSDEGNAKFFRVRLLKIAKKRWAIHSAFVEKTELNDS